MLPDIPHRKSQQLASILAEAGLNVIGPEQETYAILLQPHQPPPLEWGCSSRDIDLMSTFHDALSIVIRHNPKYGKRTNFPVGAMRLHFMGDAEFEASGIVSIK